MGAFLKGEFSGLRRLRAGAYRIVYEVSQQNLIVLVVRIRHLREV
ncbi:MAG: type II toxin-antitoxin system RelE/ParE family toxin [Acidobacteriota bacterium]